MANKTPNEALGKAELPATPKELWGDEEDEIRVGGHEGLFAPTLAELEQLEEDSKDQSKRLLVAQALSLTGVSHDRKLLVACREEFKEIIPLLDSQVREIRVGALFAVLGAFQKNTLVSKKDLRLLAVRLQPKTEQRVAAVQATSKGRGRVKEDSDAVKAVKAKYPDASQRTKDSDYAREIREARKKH